MFVVTELEKLVGELNIGVLKTKRKQEQYEVRMDSHHNSKYTVLLVAIDFPGGKRNLKMNFKNSLVIHEGNTKQISTMTVTLYLIKHIDVGKILYKILMNIGFYIKLSS